MLEGKRTLNSKEEPCFPVLLDLLKNCAPCSYHIKSSRNNWQSHNKKKEGSPKSPCPLWELAWPAAVGSEHLAAGGSTREQLLRHSLQVTSGIWEFGEKLTKQSKRKEILRQRSPLCKHHVSWSNLVDKLQTALTRAKNCGEIHLWEEKNKSFLTDKGRNNSTIHCMNDWMKNWNSLLWKSI